MDNNNNNNMVNVAQLVLGLCSIGVSLYAAYLGVNLLIALS